MASNPIVNMFKVKELRVRLFFTLIVLAVFRLGSVITIPGLRADVLINYFQDQTTKGSNGFASYIDFFVGGAFSHFSLFMLGVMPFISTQIIMQLAVIIFPALKRAVSEDGGQRKLAKWTRMGTIVVCLLQALAVTQYAQGISWNGQAALQLVTWTDYALIIVAVTAGSMITVWLGDQITANGIGNGISMLIFAGIVARMPSAIMELISWTQADPSATSVRVVEAIVVFVFFLAVIGLVIFEESGERKIPVNYAKRVVGRKMYGGQSTYIPFKVNPSNVIPLIFASSLLTLPVQVISMLGNGNADSWLSRLANTLNPDGILYNVLLVVLIIFFAYFYTQVTLNPTEIAKNIRENGGSIPGVRPEKTEEYLQKILNRLVFPGALFLAFIAVIPTVVQHVLGFPPSAAMLMGGTSLIILVGVDLDTMSQIDAVMKMHHQEGLNKKGKIRSRNL